MHALAIPCSARSRSLSLPGSLRPARGLLRPTRICARGAGRPGRLRSRGPGWGLRGRRRLRRSGLRRRRPAFHGRGGCELRCECAGRPRRTRTKRRVRRGRPRSVRACDLAAHRAARGRSAGRRCVFVGNGAGRRRGLARIRSQWRGLGPRGSGGLGSGRGRPRPWRWRRSGTRGGVPRIWGLHSARLLAARCALRSALALQARHPLGESERFGAVHVGRRGERLPRGGFACTEVQLDFSSELLTRAGVEWRRLARQGAGAEQMERKQCDVERETRGCGERPRKARMAVERGGDGDGDHSHCGKNEHVGRPSLRPSAALRCRALPGHAPLIHAECRIVAFL